ncbi:transglutaminase domain-containing protein [Aureibacter tunicatorum]|uniref:Transglutaminase-like domain-containing protein n=1 Tax=Aureibacter tunicatorum TaxID=866807 RepID=A0AAE3XTG0_9BACT|nr:transglutaminase domain-containing protein [Aureibacter tunicatorum]MDR6241546.1 hypothetical protein [Aureibacter tunicatorum]BDD07230.1 hypothetical protein AUTU_47130 [Aureibacter tunicatorum]
MRIYLLTLFSFLSQLGFGQISDFKEVDFQKADSIAYSHDKEDLKNLPILSYKLTSELDRDVEKFRSIFTWVSTNIIYDHDMYKKIQAKERKYVDDSLALNNWKKSMVPIAFEKLEKQRKTTCGGYAYLINELAKMADLECELIIGYSKTPVSNTEFPARVNHTWNAVKLNGKWYLCDATFASGYYDPNIYEYVPEYNEYYFLSDPDLFIMNHYPLDHKWLLTDTKTSLEQFILAPVIYKEAYKHDFKPSQPSTLKVKMQKGISRRFSFITDKAFKDEDITLWIGEKVKRKPALISNGEGRLEFDITFNSKGTYDLHVQVSEDYVASYVVKVKK